VLDRGAGDHAAAFTVGVRGADQGERLAVAGEGHPGPRLVEGRGHGRDRNLGHGGWSSGRDSVQTGTVGPHLVVPERPVVPALILPVVKRMADAFRTQDGG